MKLAVAVETSYSSAAALSAIECMKRQVVRRRQGDTLDSTFHVAGTR